MTRNITRRGFIKSGAVVAASAVLAGCQTPRRSVMLEPYVRPPEEQVSGVAKWYASTCRMCGGGCGIIVRVMNGRALKIEGNPEHPLNQGKLCARGQAGLQLLYNPDRLQGPVQQGPRASRQFEPISWDNAIGSLAGRLQQAGAAVAVFAGSGISGHLYDLFRRFTDATGAHEPVLFDLAGAVEGRQNLLEASNRLFGRAAQPAFLINAADVVISFADFLGASTSAVRYGIEYGRFRTQPQGRRGHLVQFEPRMSITGAKADEWFPLRAGSEGLVARALARMIADEGLGPADRVERARELAGDFDLDGVPEATGVPAEALLHVARLLAEAEQAVVIPGPVGGDEDIAAETLASILALNTVAGTAGSAGSVTLTPAAPEGLVRPVVSSLQEVAGLVDRMRAGEVQVLLMHGVNPAYELPATLGFGDALQNVPFVVSFSPLIDDSALQADLILPDRTYLESWGYDVVSPSFGRPIVTSQQPVVSPVFDARSTADVLLEAAKTVPAAAEALAWNDEVAFLKETITRLPAGSAGGAGADALWARFLQHGGWWPAAPDEPEPLQVSSPAPADVALPAASTTEFPLSLYVYQPVLLGDGRGAALPWLAGSPDPMTTIAWQTWIEIHPETAAQYGLQYGDVVRVTSAYGELEVPVYIYRAIRPDTVAIPLGQGHTAFGRYAENRGANPMRLLGEPGEWTTVPVSLTRTGRRIRLATLEWIRGVNEGFINRGMPGE